MTETSNEKLPSDSLKLKIVDRVIHDFDEYCDSMEIARALLAVAFKRVEWEGVEMATGYYRHLRDCGERHLARTSAFVRECALKYETEKTTEADLS